MDRLEQLGQDLQYVRSAMERGEASPAPRLICFLWAAIGGIGFALVDLRGEWAPAYWTVAGPTGFLASLALGWRHARLTGRLRASSGLRNLLHWGAMMAAILLAGLLPARGLLSWAGTGPAFLLLLALGYFLAGVHLDRAFRWIGLLLAGGYLLVLFAPAHAWLLLGVLFAVALVAAGLRAESRAEA